MDYLRSIGDWIYHFQTLITGLIAVVAASLTIYYMRKQLKDTQDNLIEEKRRQKKASLTSFSYKVMSYVDSISRMHRHIKSIKNDHPTYEDKALWRVFQPIVPDGVELPSLNANDVAILSELGEVEKFSGAARLQRSAKSIEGTIEHYNLLRQEWSDKSSDHTEFNISSPKTAGVTEFVLKKNPHLVRLISEQENLVSDLVTFVAEAESYGIQYSKDIEPILKEHGVFRFSIPTEEK